VKEGKFPAQSNLVGIDDEVLAEVIDSIEGSF